MRPSQALNLHRSQIREIAMRHRVAGVSVFGSAIHGDDIEGSDLDLLVDPTPATPLLDIGAIRYELKALLGMEETTSRATRRAWMPPASRQTARRRTR